MDTIFDKEDRWVLVTPESTALDCFDRDEWKSGIEWAMETDLQNPKILYYMGHCFEFGLGGESKDLSKAFYWYKASAEKGDADGQCSLGYFYEFGIGTEIDFKEAFRWYKEAAENGNTLGQVLVGLCYKHGKGTVESIEEAFRWYKIAADNGDAWGQCNLGGCYELGEGTEKNADEAFRLYKMSAENGDACGQYNLGRCYELGMGAEKNSDKAFKWYSMAAEHGDEAAKKKLTERGKSTDVSSQSIISSIEENEVLWDILNALTDREQQIVDFRFGISDGCRRTMAETGRVFGKSAAAIHKIEDRALRKLKRRLNSMKTREEYFEDAKSWLEKLEILKKEVDLSAVDSDGDEEENERESSVIVNALEAFKNKHWAMGQVLAAKTDLTDARLQYYMGYCCENGFGTTKDYDAANEWYENAAKQGNEEAKKRLKKLEWARRSTSNNEDLEMCDVSAAEQMETPIVQNRMDGKNMKKPSAKKAYKEMNAVTSEVLVVERDISVVEMVDIDDYLYCLEIPEGVNEEVLLEASNELFHRIGVLPEDRNLAVNEESEYCTVHRNEYSGKCFVLFNHPIVMERDDCGDTVKMFGEAQRKAIAEEEAEGEENCDYAEEDDEAWMRQLAEDIKSGAIRSKSGEGYFVLKGEYYDAIEAGRKTTEYRDLTPRNLSLSIGIKTVKFQRGYGHPGQPPKQMRYEVSSARLMDASDRECDPYAIPPGFIATTIAIHLGKRIG